VEGARLVRAGALAYVSIDSDLDSGQWHKLEALLRKFPGREKWLRQLRQQLAEQNLDYANDIAPALGPEVDIAVVGGAEGITYAWLTKPESTAKAEALARKLAASADPPEKSAARVVDGWVVVSDSLVNLDRVLKPNGGDALADEDAFKSAMAELPDDAVGKAFVSSKQLDDLLRAFESQGPFAGKLMPFGLDKVESFAAAVAARDDGIRFDGRVKGGGVLTSAGEAYKSKLLAGVPADAFVFATFRGGDTKAQLEQLRRDSRFGGALDVFTQMSGLDLDDVPALFDHEVAVYARPGVGTPEFSAVLEEPETEKALATLDRLAATVASMSHTRVKVDERDGLAVKSLTFGSVTVEWTGFDGRVLLTTGPNGIADYRSKGPKLADDPNYQTALAAAGVPDETSGLLYFDLHDAIPLIESYVGRTRAGLSTGVRANLRPLRAFVAYATRSGDATKASAFLELR
jgi:Protein of unknown function (DUF3352)